MTRERKEWRGSSSAEQLIAPISSLQLNPTLMVIAMFHFVAILSLTPASQPVSSSELSAETCSLKSSREAAATAVAFGKIWYYEAH